MALINLDLIDWNGIVKAIDLDRLKELSRTPIKNLSTWVNHVDNTVELGVTYRLFYRNDLNNLSTARMCSEFRDRLGEILNLREPTPKYARIEKARMYSRAKRSKAGKAKKK